jgi:pyrroloquinoline quinone biosynthesis protein B
MRIIVLGSAAGGGFPQWNCACANCAAVRRGEPGFPARTQSSLAVTANNRDFLLLNASPDLRAQIAATPALHARGEFGTRDSPIAAVLVTNADVDHIGGLLTLRERQPFTLYATDMVSRVIESNSIFGVLSDVVVRRTVALDRPTDISGPGGALGLTVEAFAVPGKVALFLEQGTPDVGALSGNTIGLRIADQSGRSFYYIPGCAAVDAPLAERLGGASLVFFDGTLFTDDEMIAQGLSAKTGRRMGHVPMSGEGGSLDAFARLGVRRRVYVHMNNSNPVLDPASAERRAVERAGWEVAHDGLEIDL